MFTLRAAFVQFSSDYYPKTYPNQDAQSNTKMKTQGIFVTHHERVFFIMHCTIHTSVTADCYTLTLIDRESLTKSIELKLKPGEVFFNYEQQLFAIEIAQSMIEQMLENDISVDPWPLMPVELTEENRQRMIFTVSAEDHQLIKSPFTVETKIIQKMRHDPSLFEIPFDSGYRDENAGLLANNGAPLVQKTPHDEEILTGIFASLHNRNKRSEFIPTQTIISFLTKIIAGDFDSVEISLPEAIANNYQGPAIREVRMWLPCIELQEIPNSATDFVSLQVSRVFKHAAEHLQQGDVITAINNSPIENRAVLLPESSPCCWKYYFNQVQQQTDTFTFSRGENHGLTASVNRVPHVHSGSPLRPWYFGTVDPFIHIGPWIFFVERNRDFKAYHRTNHHDDLPSIHLKKYDKANHGAIEKREASVWKKITEPRIVFNTNGLPQFYKEYYEQQVRTIKIDDQAEQLVTTIEQLWDILHSQQPPFNMTVGLSQPTSTQQDARPIIYVTYAVPAELFVSQETNPSTSPQKALLATANPQQNTPSTPMLRRSIIISPPKKSSEITIAVNAKDSLADQIQDEKLDAIFNDRTFEMESHLVYVRVAVYNKQRPMNPCAAIFERTGLLIRDAQSNIGILMNANNSSFDETIEVVTTDSQQFVVTIQDCIMIKSSRLIILKINSNIQALIDRSMFQPTFEPVAISSGENVNILSFHSSYHFNGQISRLIKTQAKVENPTELRTINLSQLTRMILTGGSLKLSFGGGFVLNEAGVVVGMVEQCNVNQGLIIVHNLGTIQHALDYFNTYGFNAKQSVSPEHPDVGILTQPIGELTARTLHDDNQGARIIACHSNLADKVAVGDLLTQITIGSTHYQVDSNEQVQSLINKQPLIHWKQLIHLATMGTEITLTIKRQNNESEINIILQNTYAELSQYTLRSANSPYVEVGNLHFIPTPPPSSNFNMQFSNAIEQNSDPLFWYSNYPSDKTAPSKFVSLAHALDSMYHQWRSYLWWYVVSVNGKLVDDLQSFYQLLLENKKQDQQSITIKLCNHWSDDQKVVFIELPSLDIMTNLFPHAHEQKNEDSNNKDPNSNPKVEKQSPVQNVGEEIKGSDLNIHSMSNDPYARSIVQLHIVSEQVRNNPLSGVEQTIAIASGFFIKEDENKPLCLITAAHALFDMGRVAYPVSIKIIIPSIFNRRFILTRKILKSLSLAVYPIPGDIACIVLDDQTQAVIRDIQKFAKPLALMESFAIEPDTAVSILGFNGSLEFTCTNVLLGKITGVTFKLARSVGMQRKILSPAITIDTVRISPGLSGSVVVQKIGDEFKALAMVVNANGDQNGKIIDRSAMATDLSLLPAIIQTALNKQLLYQPPMLPFTLEESQKLQTGTAPAVTVHSICQILVPECCQQLQEGETLNAITIGRDRYRVEKTGAYSERWKVHVPLEYISQLCLPKSTIMLDIGQENRAVACQLTKVRTDFLQQWPIELYSVLSQTTQQWLLFAGFVVAEATTLDTGPNTRQEIISKPVSKQVIVKEILPFLLVHHYQYLEAIVQKIGNDSVEGLASIPTLYKKHADSTTVRLQFLFKNGVTKSVTVTKDPAKQSKLITNNLLFRRRPELLEAVLDPIDMNQQGQPMSSLPL